MKIKGILKGNPVEWSAEEKPLVMVRDHVPTFSTQEETHWAEDIKVTKLNVIQGGKNEKGFSNHSYQAEGTYNRRVSRASSPKQMLKAVPMKFKVVIKDTLDDTGMPHMIIVDFKDESSEQ